jgi:hypothetical protein
MDVQSAISHLGACFNSENWGRGLHKYYRGFLARMLRWELEARI